jgi:hypothetical protein
MFGRRPRHGPPSPHHLGPWNGAYYENVARVVRGGPVLAWNGKRAVQKPHPFGEEPPVPYIFTDGSFADPVTGEFHNAAGDGSMISVTGPEADAAAEALFGSQYLDWERCVAHGTVWGAS